MNEQALFSRIVAGHLDNEYAIDIWDRSEKIFQSDGAAPKEPDSSLAQIRSFRFADQDWTLRVTPSENLRITQAGTLPSVVLVAGLAITTLLGSLVYFAQSHWMHEKKIQAANALKRELKQRQESEEAIRRLAEDLKRSNQELENFAYVASHDLKEPLRMVTSYLMLLERQLQGSAR